MRLVLGIIIIIFVIIITIFITVIIIYLLWEFFQVDQACSGYYYIIINIIYVLR